MACLPTVESRFDLRVDQQAERVLASSGNESAHTKNHPLPNTHPPSHQINRFGEVTYRS
jgi:hypothetical protein